MNPKIKIKELLADAKFRGLIELMHNEGWHHEGRFVSSENQKTAVEVIIFTTSHSVNKISLRLEQFSIPFTIQ